MKPEMNRSHERPKGRGLDCSVKARTGFNWLGQGLEVGSSEHGDEPLGSIKVGNFLIS